MDLMTLAAKITLDTGDYTQGVKGVEKSGKELAGKLSARTIALGNMMGNFATSAIKTVGSVAVNIFKKSYKAFADYEQLVGGIDTLFKRELDPNAYNLVMENAQKAFKTAGMSANQYMETVTAFSASLIQSLGGDTYKAAEVADMAIQDMADNANKMGTDMASVENAYKGFAKQNYTMLDNLKLGYGGTRGEMERLLKDAEKITKKKYNINNLADVYEAIHEIQKQLGVTGATAAEADKTVEGSTKMMKASWENLLIAIGNGKNVKKATKDFTNSLKTVVKNTVPVIKNIAYGLGEAIRNINWNDVLKTGWEIIDSLGRGLFGKNWDITINWIQNAWSDVQNALLEVGWWVGKTFLITINWVRDGWNTVMWAFTEAGKWAGNIFQTTISWVRSGWNTVMSAFTAAGEWTGKLFAVTIQWVQNAWTPINNAFNKAKDWTGKMFNIVFTWVQNAWKTLSNAFDTAGAWAGETFNTTIKWVQDAWNTVSDSFAEAGKWANKAFQTTINWVKGTTKSVTDFIKSIPESINVAVNFVAGVGRKVGEGLGGAIIGGEQGGEIGGKVWDLILAELGIGHAKGAWSIPYDNYPALLHRNERVLTASQARQQDSNAIGNTSEIVGALESVRNDLQNMQLVVGQRTFGRTVVDYGGRRMRNYIGGADSRLAAGYGA